MVSYRNLLETFETILTYFEFFKNTAPVSLFSKIEFLSGGDALHSLSIKVF